MVYQMSILNLLDLYHRQMQRGQLVTDTWIFIRHSVLYFAMKLSSNTDSAINVFTWKTDLYMYMWQKSTRLDNFTIPSLQKKCFYCTCSVQSINTSLSSLGIRTVFSSGRYEPSHCSYLRFLNLQASRFVWMAMTI